LASWFSRRCEASTGDARKIALLIMRVRWLRDVRPMPESAMRLAGLILKSATSRVSKDEVLELKIIPAWTLEAFAAASGDDRAAQHVGLAAALTLPDAQLSRTKRLAASEGVNAVVPAW